MKRNQMIGFGVLALGGILVFKFLSGLIAMVFKLAIVGGLAFLGYSYFKKG